MTKKRALSTLILTALVTIAVSSSLELVAVRGPPESRG